MARLWSWPVSGSVMHCVWCICPAAQSSRTGRLARHLWVVSLVLRSAAVRLLAVMCILCWLLQTSRVRSNCGRSGKGNVVSDTHSCRCMTYSRQVELLKFKISKIQVRNVTNPIVPSSSVKTVIQIMSGPLVYTLSKFNETALKDMQEKVPRHSKFAE